MRSSSRRVAAIAAAATLTLGVASCASPSDSRPDPTDVVQRYLDAIASGDAQAAAALDADTIEDDPLTDATTLRTDDVLAGAVRIDDVEVEPETRSIVHDGEGEERGVDFSFTLAGESYDATLPVGWNSDAAEWRLLDTLAQPLQIQAQVTRAEAALIGFRLPGAAVPAPADQGDAPVQWLVYPGVYTVTADLDPALLVDPALGVERDVVIDAGSEQPSLVYEVTSLP